MQKNYEADTQKAIEQVIRVFQDYIKASPHFDLLLFSFAVVDFLLPRKAACGIFLLRQRISGVFFVLQYVLDGGQLPILSAVPRWTAQRCDFLCNILHTDTCKVTVEDMSDD